MTPTPQLIRYVGLNGHVEAACLATDSPMHRYGSLYWCVTWLALPMALLSENVAHGNVRYKIYVGCCRPLILHAGIRMTRSSRDAKHHVNPDSAGAALIHLQTDHRSLKGSNPSGKLLKRFKPAFLFFFGE